MEKIKVFSAGGDIVLERDLAGIEKPLMILAGDKPELVEVVPQGADVLGALVRDEDGWTLASAKVDAPVSSGPKSGSDFHLTAGVPCAIGPWVFRIEREGALTGTVLLWRVGSSAVAADPLLPGRNIVVATGAGAYSVNPAVGGEEICSICPTADGADVTTPVSGDMFNADTSVSIAKPSVPASVSSPMLISRGLGIRPENRTVIMRLDPPAPLLFFAFPGPFPWPLPCPPDTSWGCSRRSGTSRRGGPPRRARPSASLQGRPPAPTAMSTSRLTSAPLPT